MTPSRRRKAALSFILLALCSATPQFFSELNHFTHDQPCQRLSSRILGQRDPPRESDLARLLLSPTTIFHLSWIVGLFFLSTMAFADLFLRLIFIVCTLAMNYLTGESIRYMYDILTIIIESNFEASTRRAHAYLVTYAS